MNDIRKISSPIYCIGDSHVSYFSGEDKIQPAYPSLSHNIFPFFKTFHIGPVLAFNLCKEGTQSTGREKVFSVIYDHIPPNSRIMLCFGEIDCRAHIMKQSILQKRNIEHVVDVCVNRYFSVILEIIKLGHEVIIWNVIPSTRLDNVYNNEYPVIGSCEERNFITRQFNDYLRKLCGNSGVIFISVFDELLDANGLTNMNYYMDSVHLSQKSMLITIQKMKKCVPAFSPSIPIGYRLKRMLSFNQAFTRLM